MFLITSCKVEHKVTQSNKGEEHERSPNTTQFSHCLTNLSNISPPDDPDFSSSQTLILMKAAVGFLWLKKAKENTVQVLWSFPPLFLFPGNWWKLFPHLFCFLFPSQMLEESIISLFLFSWLFGISDYIKGRTTSLFKSCKQTPLCSFRMQSFLFLLNKEPIFPNI